MSKKSRRRNKKILAALTAGLGAAALVKGRKGAVTDVPLNPNLQKTIAADAGADIAAEVAQDVPAKTSNFQTKYTTKRDGAWKSPNQLRLEREAMPGYGVEGPPSVLNPYRHIPNPRGFRGKGGGIAKRGMGAAYKKGGRVKSMGIAKRGGGAAKR